MKKMVTIKEFANLSGLSVWAVRMLSAEGRIPSVRIGLGRGKIFINAANLDEILQSLTIKPIVEITKGIRRIAK